MRAGLLNERVDVYTLTTTRDASGAKVHSLTLRATYYCRVMNAAKQRETDADRLDYAPDITFQLRRQVLIMQTDILEYDGQKYVIRNIDKNRNTDTQTLSCMRYEQ